MQYHNIIWNKLLHHVPALGYSLETASSQLSQYNKPCPLQHTDAHA
jgi:hypothetical protein